MRPKAPEERRNKPDPGTVTIYLPLLILIAALAIRTVSIFSFDTLFDEQITSDVVTGIWHGELSNNWKYTVQSPEFRIDLYNFSTYMYADAAVAGVFSEVADTLSGGKSHLVGWSRLFSALLGTIGVYLVYLIAWRLWGSTTALVAMLLAAVMPLLVQDSQYARPEAFVVGLTLVAYLYLLKFNSEPGRLWYLGAAGFCFGLLVACKSSLAPMAILPVAFLFPGKNRSRLLPALATCGGVTLLGVFLGVPDAFFHPAAFLRGVDFLRRHYAGVHPPHGLVDGTNSIPLMGLYLWQTLGLLFCLFALVGVFALAWGQRFLLFAVLAGPVLFYVPYFALQRIFFERNVSHVARAILCNSVRVRLAS